MMECGEPVGRMHGEVLEVEHERRVSCRWTGQLGDTVVTFELTPTATAVRSVAGWVNKTSQCSASFPSLTEGDGTEKKSVGGISERSLPLNQSEREELSPCIPGQHAGVSEMKGMSSCPRSRSRRPPWGSGGLLVRASKRRPGAARRVKPSGRFLVDRGAADGYAAGLQSRLRGFNSFHPCEAPACGLACLQHDISIA